MSPAVELIFDATCPNVEAARQILRVALGHAGLPAEWKEWERAAPTSPAYTRRYGSPTVLVGGRDVAGDDAGLDGDAGCRVYSDTKGGLRGVPNVTVLVAALSGYLGKL